MQPDMLPSYSPGPSRGRLSVSLALAAVWLAVSVAGGAWLFFGTDSGAVTLHATKPVLAAESSHTVYGGDAYTGIQNAASDTEHAVVDGTNGLANLSQELADSSASFNRGLANRMQQGLGILVVGVGLLNFTVAMSRRRGAE